MIGMRRDSVNARKICLRNELGYVPNSALSFGLGRAVPNSSSDATDNMLPPVNL